MDNNIEKINLEDQPKQKNRFSNKNHNNDRRKRFIRKNKQPRQRPQFRQQRRPRQNEGGQSRGRDRYYQVDIYHMLAKNSISDLLQDIRKMCGNLVKLNIVITDIKEAAESTEIIIKSYFSDRQSAEQCYDRYNNANLDNKELQAERRY